MKIAALCLCFLGLRIGLGMQDAHGQPLDVSQAEIAVTVSRAPAFVPVAPTGISQPVFFDDVAVACETLESGDEIGIFDGSLCVGMWVVDSFPAVEPATVYLEATIGESVLPGAQPGNEMIFVAWDASSDTKTPVSVTQVLQGPDPPVFQAAQTVELALSDDGTAPEITLLGDADVTMEVHSTYTDAAATAQDNCDGDITASIFTVNPVNTAVVGDYTVTYNVSDAAGNPATQVTRTVHVVDTTAPVITRLGDAEVSIEVGSAYVDAGATASDNYDGDITANIVTVNPVNTAVVDDYTVTYDVSDAAGNPAVQMTRIVHVVSSGAGSGPLPEPLALAPLPESINASVEPVLAWEVGFTDDFSDAVADGWVERPGGPGLWTVEFDPASGSRAYRISGTFGNASNPWRLGEYALFGDCVAGEFEISGRLRTTNGAPTGDLSVVFGYQDDTHYYAAIFSAENPASTNGLFIVNAADIQRIGDFPTRPSIVDGAYSDFRVVRGGDTIEMHVDGELLTTATDSTFPTGRLGVGTVSSTGYFDDIVIRTTAPDLGYPLTYDVRMATGPGPLELIASGLEVPVCDPGRLELDMDYSWEVVLHTPTESIAGSPWGFHTVQDIVPPEIEIIGDNPEVIEQYSVHEDRGATATDLAVRVAKVMLLGDSITQGNGSFNSYRRMLWHSLDAAGHCVDFVGSRDTNFDGVHPPEPDFDLDHEGHWGWRVEEVLGAINAWATAAQPDIVLVHLGTNDALADQSAASTLDELDELVDRLRSANPSITLLLATLIPAADAGVNARIDEINAGLPALVTAKDTADSRVILVDQNTGFDPATDTYDGLHPDLSGEAKMAANWFPVLDALLAEPYVVDLTDQIQVVDNVDLGLIGIYYVYYSVEDAGGNLTQESREVHVVETTPPAVTVTNPDDGETVIRGLNETITWNSTGNVGAEVKIRVFKGALFLVLAESTPNDGSYDWAVPEYFPDGSDYLIEVSSVANPSIIDTSDGPFELAGGITVTSPNGGESVALGATEIITWDSTDNTGADVTILVFKGTQFLTLAESTPNDGSYEWTVQEYLPDGSDYLIVVVSVASPSVFDTSDGAFTVYDGGGPPVTLTNPNGGETVIRGSTETITWSSTDNVGANVKIRLLKGALFLVLAESTPNTGVFDWAVQDYLPDGSDYLIEVSSATNPGIFDTSDATFTIAGGITVTNPNGGETVTRETTETITWDSTAAVGADVKIRLFKGTQFLVLAESTSNDGSYDWAVQDYLPDGADYFIAVSSVTNPSIIDTSDATFTIQQ